MALATLDLCINNKDVFNKSVKISKGEAAILAFKSNNYEEFCDIAEMYINNMLLRL